MVLGVTHARQSPDRSYGEKLISLFAKLLFTGRRYCLTDLVGRREYVWIERPDFPDQALEGDCAPVERLLARAADPGRI